MEKSYGKSEQRSEMSLTHGEDRINSLPDELLIHVISFLPATEDAIRTSIMSKRWKYLWTCLPNYNFEYTDGTAQDRSIRLVDCVDRLFKLCHPGLCINKFSLCSRTTDFLIPKVEAWVECLVSHNIQELQFEITHGTLFRFPKSLFTCETLVDLKLLGYSKLADIPTFVSLPNLKTLHIYSLKYNNQTISTFLSSGCPILEELYLEISSAYDDVVEALNISVPSLKKLSITHYYDLTIIIDATLLEYLKLYSSTSSHISLNTMPSLVEAHVGVVGFEENDQLWNLLKHISHIKRLKFSPSTIEYFCPGQEARDIPQFPNMELLTIGSGYWSGRWDYKNLPNLLDRMPKLNGIVFERHMQGDDAHNFNLRMIHQDAVPVCLMFHLKTVKFNRFSGKRVEQELVKYFLENANVLESITIHIDQHCVGDAIKGFNIKGFNMKNAGALEKITITC